MEPPDIPEDEPAGEPPTEEEEAVDSEEDTSWTRPPGRALPAKPTRRRGARRGRRGGRRRRSGRPDSFEATFDHGEEGYGLWLDPAVADSDVYSGHWAGHREVTVTRRPGRDHHPPRGEGDAED